MDTEITIIGAGIIGLAIAAELSAHQSSVFVLEKNLKFGQETSSRNSEVIHSGIYYPIHSFKARFCAEGRDLLYRYCKDHDIGYRKCGKLIISNKMEEKEDLLKIKNTAITSEVMDGRFLNKEEIKTLEPNINAVAGIFFPSTGIVDSHSLMHQMETDAINQGTEIVYGSELIGIKKIEGGYQLMVSEPGGNNFSFTSRYLINAAGLQAEKIARMAGLNKNNYKTYFWKGEYFSFGNGKHKLISRLIYPLPERNNIGLGIHTTPDLSGRMKLGPNTIFLEQNQLDYTTNPDHRLDFYHSASKFLPFLEPEDLIPDQVGIRPKLQKPGDPVRDFEIKEESDSGFPGLVNLVGIESPGLTACLSIARYVKTLLERL